MSGTFCSVAFDLPLYQRFTYRIPAELDPWIQPGVRVLAPWAKGARTGVILARDTEPPEDFPVSKIRPLADILDLGQSLPAQQLALCEWIADYYAAPIGQVVQLALPPDGARKAHRQVVWTGESPTEELPAIARELLEILQNSERPLDPLELLRQLKGARHSDLQILEDQGLLHSQYAADEGLSIQTEDWITLLGTDGRSLGAAQARVVEYLEREGPCTDRQLRAEFGTPRAVLRALEGRGIIRIETRERTRNPFEGEVDLRTTEPPLTPTQAQALGVIAAASQEAPRTVLLHGVTGSGKTEVYVRAAQASLRAGLRVLILLPEIALTPQFVGVFRQAIDTPIAVLHSGLSPGERFDQWRRIRDGQVSLVIGARSALFAPMSGIGLIIVDEEHDPSFKQGEGVLYNARDAAVLLAHRMGATCILGSATPSLESLRNAREGRYRLASMPERVAARPMPLINVVDMAHNTAHQVDPLPGESADGGDDMDSWISEALAARVRMTASRGEQSILFLNRRGFAPSVQCEDCGTALTCPDCDISLTLHRSRGEVSCHYCGFTTATPKHCPTCRSENLQFEGAGTERIEDAVAQAFSDLRVGRLDRDTSRGKSLGRVLDAFRRGEIDVLIGTQMVTKGHDFPNVTLVGILNADQSLVFPDFRSGERTFQLLTQVAGRAGRGERSGEVLVQTWRPEHYVIEAVAQNDFDSFVEREMRFRERLVYPPFGHLFAIRVSAPEHHHAMEFIETLTRYVRSHGDGSLRVTGPTDSPIARRRNRYRVQAMVRAQDRAPVRQAIRLVMHAALALEKEHSGRDIRWEVDVDAIQLL